MNPEIHSKIATILAKDKRYTANAYQLVCEALQYTFQQKASPSSLIKAEPQAVKPQANGPELLNGFRQYVLAQYGPMSLTLLHAWGLKSSQDIGNIVQHLVDVAVFGKSNGENLNDFSKGLDFDEGFRNPFLPKLKSTKSATRRTRKTQPPLIKDESGPKSS
jgi:uncharacterized repeat protein (TIGR04138 family)